MYSTFTNHLINGLFPENFTNHKIIDKGAYGRVFKCINNSRTYAVKIVTIEKEPSSVQAGKEQEAKLQEIQRELNILQKIEETSPKPSSIIPFHGYYIEENHKEDKDFCFVFDLLNQSLKTLIEEHSQANQGFSIAELMKLYKQMLYGMTFLQNLQVTHRDLKPGNLLLDSNNNIKIIDFGVSVNISDLIKKDQQDTLATLAVQTRFDMEIGGTKLYFSPEILEKWIEFKQKPNENNKLLILNPYKSDVFSFGLILLEAATLRLVKHQDDLTRLEKKIQEHLDIFLKAHSNLKEKEFQDFKFLWKRMEKCLKMKVEERPDFLNLFKEDLDEPKIPFHISIEEMSLQQNKELFGQKMEREEMRTNEIQSLTEENQMLQKENFDLKNKQNDTEALDHLKSEINVLKKENLALTQENGKHLQENITLKNEIKEKLEMKKKSDQQVKNMDQLKCEIDLVKYENFVLKQENGNLITENNLLKKEKKVLNQEKDQLKQEINQLKKENIALIEVNGNLIQESDALKKCNKGSTIAIEKVINDLFKKK